MAPSAKHFPFLLLFFALLSSSLQYSHARESYFFNKATNNKNNAKETVVEEGMPNKSNVEEQDPNFIPDTQSGYGLYGQKSGRHPAATNHPSEIESFEPYTTAASNNNYDKNEAYVSDPQGMMSDTRFIDGRYTTTAATKTTSGPPYTTTTTSNNDNNYYKNEAVNDPQGVSDTRFTDRSYTTTTATSGTPYAAANLPYKTESGESYPTTTINNDNNNYYNKEAYVSDPHEGMSQDTRFINRGANTAASSNNYYYNGGGRSYNTQQQGMSDTRFLENGRYYYDINNEENYRNGYQTSRRVGHNDRGYYGNVNGNSMEEGYQNQDDQFQESEAEYVP